MLSSVGTSGRWSACRRGEPAGVHGSLGHPPVLTLVLPKSGPEAGLTRDSALLLLCHRTGSTTQDCCYGLVLGRRADDA
jgi:hypothetical protein